MLVAVHISNYKKKPVIGKVIEVCDHEIKLHYWKGTYSTAWQPHMVKCNKEIKPWTENLPKHSVIICAFEFDENNKLLENTRRYLKRWYRDQAKRVEDSNAQ